MKTIFLAFEGRYEPMFVGAYSSLERAQAGVAFWIKTNQYDAYYTIRKCIIDAGWEGNPSAPNIMTDDIVNMWVKYDGSSSWERR